MAEFYLKNANVVDVRNKTIREGQCLRVADGKFAECTEIPAGAQVIDCNGKYVSPGLIDAHVHLVWDGRSPDPMTDTVVDGDFVSFARGVENALLSLKAGVTYTRDVGSCNDTAFPLAESINRGIVPGCRIIPCGGAIQGSYGHCPMIGTICDTEAELIAKIKQLKAMYVKHKIAGPHWIKIMASGGAAGLEDVGPCMYSPKELETIAYEAHRLNMKVAAHALSFDAISKCVDAGIDTIEHGAEMTPEILQQMKDNGQTWVPTLAVYKMLAESRGVIADIIVDKSEIVTVKQKASFAKAMEMGTNIIMGSDAGSANFGPHPSGLVEMLAMEDYGMPKDEVLRRSTIHSAETLGIKNYGAVEPGYTADFVVLNMNPLTEGVKAYMNGLETVYKSGEPV